MNFFSLIGLGVVLYIFVYVVFVAFSDCDLRLFWNTVFGKSIDSLKGKVVWISGASSGIGKFLAIELAKNGASVILSARSLENLERSKEECLEAGASVEQIFILPMDVTEKGKHEEHFRRVIDRFGKLDILVNIAGRSQRAVWEETEVDVDKEAFELNAFSVVSLSEIAARYFSEVGGGHIVVMLSVAALFGVRLTGSYSATKRYLHGYFKCFKTENRGGNIAVTLLYPGPVYSNNLQVGFTGKKGEMLKNRVGSLYKKMATNRCAYLCAVAIANKLDEAWMGLFPLVPYSYLSVYLPNIFKLYMTKNIA